MSFIINALIIYIIITELYFHSDKHEECDHKKALKIFKIKNDNLNQHIFNVSNVLQFKLIINHNSLDYSFRQVEAIRASTKILIGLAQIENINNTQVVNTVHAIVAINLQSMTQLLHNNRSA